MIARLLFPGILKKETVAMRRMAQCGQTHHNCTINCQHNHTPPLHAYPHASTTSRCAATPPHHQNNLRPCSGRSSSSYKQPEAMQLGRHLAKRGKRFENRQDVTNYTTGHLICEARGKTSSTWQQPDDMQAGPQIKRCVETEQSPRGHMSKNTTPNTTFTNQIQTEHATIIFR